MDWLFGKRRPNLETWRTRPDSPGVDQGPRPGDNCDRHERAVAVEAPGPPAPDGVFRRLAMAIAAFDVFPEAVAIGVLDQTPVDVGAAVGVCYRLMPGLRLFFAARVYERFDDAKDELWRAGFSYRTLDGHPMCGEETFIVEKNLGTGQITVALRSWSRPAHWTTRWSRPLARRWQVRAGRSALDHLQQMVGGPDGGSGS